VHLGKGTFRGLRDRNAVLRVADTDFEATDLAPQAFTDGEAGGVVGRPVDPEARRQLLERLGHLTVGHGQVAVGVLSSDVLVDPEAHDFPSSLRGSLLPVIHGRSGDSSGRTACG
jgi:hypothetical protein